MTDEMIAHPSSTATCCPARAWRVADTVAARGVASTAVRVASAGLGRRVGIASVALAWRVGGASVCEPGASTTRGWRDWRKTRQRLNFLNIRGRDDDGAPRSPARFALAALFTLAWTVKDWASLSTLRLPDTDDAMRLQQWRDWLGGQAFGDLSQHRLADGLAMHWSRLPDLIPGGLITLFTPLAGRHLAELTTIILWPGLLFAVALIVVGRIARVQLAPVPTAILIGALAFPATGLFLPGRIDHHGLQIVLLLAGIAALLRRRGIGSGIGVGLAGIASLLIGLETAPFVALACGLVALGWVAERDGAQRHLTALAITLLAGLTFGALVFAPQAWAWPACDGFTLSLWRAAMIGAAALLALAATGPLVAGRGPRLLLAAALGGLAAVAAAVAAPACLHPYGGVDPALAARWLANVGEAQPLFAAAPAVAIGQCGLMIAGILASGWCLWRTRDPGWAILLLFQLTAAAIAVVQLRGAWSGAILAAPALAILVGAARRRGVLALAGAWLVSAGIAWPLAAERAFPTSAAPGPPACANPAALAALASLPPGRVVASIDLGAWGIAATPHTFLSAPYHRNNAGNATAFAIFDGPADRALPLATSWRIDYLAACDAQPGWWRGRLAPLARGDGLTVYALPDAAMQSLSPVRDRP